MKQWIYRLAITCFALETLIVWAAESVPQEQAPSVTLSICDNPPFLDGKLDDACWKTAAAITNFHVFKGTNETASQNAFLTRDQEWLYLAFAINRQHPNLIKQTIFEQDGGVTRDDSLEIFIDPGTKGACYLHYMLNAANVKADELVVKRGRDSVCRMAWRSATRVTEKGWNAEIAIPLRWLTIYERHGAVDLSKARINLALKVITPTIDPYLTVMYETESSLSWPAVSAYHDPSQFGFLKGLPPDGGMDLNKMFLPSFGQVRLDGYALQDEIPGYALSVMVNGKAGNVEILVEDRPVAGDSSKLRQIMNIAEGRTNALTLHVPMKVPGSRSAMVWLEDAERGGAFESRLLDEQTMIIAEPLDVLMDRNYYTSESAAMMACRIRMKPKDLSVCRIAVKLADNGTVAQSDKLEERTTIEIPLAKIKQGRTTLSVELQGADGKRIAAQETVLVKLPPNSGSEVKVDQINRVALKDGQPFFPFGLIVVRISSQNEDLFKRFADAGFNTLLWWCRPSETTAEEVRACLDLAKKHGLMVVDSVNVKPNSPKGGGTWANQQRRSGNKEAAQTLSVAEETALALEGLDKMTPGMEPALMTLKAHPNYLGSWNVDEPYDEMCIAVAGRYYKWMTERDPYHPLILLYMRRIPPGRQWTDCGEILAYDVYIYPGHDRIESQPRYMAIMTENLRRRADGLNKISWMVPMTEGLDIGRCPRTLRSEEQKCQTYMALIHGAKGLLYFCGPSTYSKNMWDALSQLAMEFRTLGPAAVAPVVPQEITYEPGVMDINNGKFPDIHAKLFRHPDGRYIIAAANAQRYPVDVRFGVSLLREGGSVRRLSAETHYAVKDGEFSDRLEHYGTRAYILECPASGKVPQPSDPVKITVTMTAHPDEAPPDPAFDKASDVVKRRNVAPNPSVEQMSSPGLPDYYRPYNNVFHYRALVGEPGAGLAVETNNPFHGRQCIRMERVKETHGTSSIKTAGLFYLPALAKPTPYVFSIYMRGAADGQAATITVDGMTPGTQTFKLTKEWQRYIIQGMVNSGGAKELSIVPENGSTVWLDALQMEKGTEPTPFTVE